MSHLKRFSLALVPLVLLTLFPLLLRAQDNMSKQDNTAMGGNQTVSVTGCLKQGTDKGGYYIMGQDGKMYELWGKGLGEHVNHTVTVTGKQVTMSASEEKKKEMAEKSEAGSGTPMDLKVSSLKMVSESCQ